MSASSIWAMTLHLGQVVGDEEQDGRLEAGGHGLADVHVALDHDTSMGGRDGGVTQIDVGHLEAGGRLLHVGGGLIVLGVGRTDGGLHLADLSTILAQTGLAWSKRACAFSRSRSEITSAS